MALEIAFVAAGIEACMPGVGRMLVDHVASLRDRKDHQPHYEAILQTFSEMLVIDRVLAMRWPDSAVFAYEPEGRSGKRPELSVQMGDARYLFEVKAPSLLGHVRKRSVPNTQLAARNIFPAEALDKLDSLQQGQSIVLPRDNPVKDLLLSAEEKFADFDPCEGANILVIVRDDYIYEPISALSHTHSGLLTENSYFRHADDEAVEFPHIDAVIVIRHLTYFYEALAERPLPDRQGAFDFGAASALPNVLFPTRWGRSLPLLIPQGLRAVDHRAQALQLAAEYQPTDLVFWF